MSTIGLTVPTRGDHPDLLARLLADCGLPDDRIVVVDTSPHGLQMLGPVVLRDTGEINIHRWWNLGIDTLAAAGVDHVAVLNDDVVITPVVLRALSHALDQHQVALAHPGSRPDELVGWCWMLDVRRGIRPDESYRWWFGDNDLWARARDRGGIVAVPGLPVEHRHPNHATAASGPLQALAEADRRLWESRWGQ